MIDIKILSYHSSQRYAVRQTVVAAKRKLCVDNPDLEIIISELKDWVHIEQYTPVLAAPSLVVNEKLVCVGRFPTREDVIGWMLSAIAEKLGIG